MGIENPRKFILTVAIILLVFIIASSGLYFWWYFSAENTATPQIKDRIEEFEVTCKNTNCSTYVLFTDKNGHDVVYESTPSQSVRFIIGHRYIITVKNGAKIIGIRDLDPKEDDARVKTVSLYTRKIMRS